MNGPSDYNLQEPPDGGIQFAAAVQRLQGDDRFLGLIQEFSSIRTGQKVSPDMAATFVQRLQKDPSFLALVEEFTGARADRPAQETPTNPPGTTGWPTAEGVIAGPKAAAAAVAAAALVAGG